MFISILLYFNTASGYIAAYSSVIPVQKNGLGAGHLMSELVPDYDPELKW